MCDESRKFLRKSVDDSSSDQYENPNFYDFQTNQNKNKINVISKKKWKLLIPIIQLLDLMNMIETKKKGTF